MPALYIAMHKLEDVLVPTSYSRSIHHRYRMQIMKKKYTEDIL